MGRKKGGGSGSGDMTFSVSISGPSKWKLADDFRSMTRKELAKEAKSVIDAANKRLKRLEEQGILSPALHAAMNSGGKFTRAGDLKKLQHEYARAVNFMNMTTSSVTGAKKYERQMEQRLGFKLSRDQKTKLFKAFKCIEKATPAGVQAYGSDKLVQYLANEITSEDDEIMNGAGEQDWDDMIERAIADVMKEYERVMDEFAESFRDSFSF